MKDDFSKKLLENLSDNPVALLGVVALVQAFNDAKTDKDEANIEMDAFGKTKWENCPKYKDCQEEKIKELEERLNQHICNINPGTAVYPSYNALTTLYNDCYKECCCDSRKKQ